MTNNKNPINDAFNLMPDELAKDMPAIGETSEKENPLVRVKWFTPWSNWTWYVIEWDPEHQIGYGLVQGFETEFGSFSRDEVQQLRASGIPVRDGNTKQLMGHLGGLRVERDLYFDPTPVNELLAKIEGRP